MDWIMHECGAGGRIARRISRAWRGGDHPVFGDAQDCIESKFDATTPTVNVLNEGAMGEKNCPYCAETIKAQAIKCRFCGSDLTKNGDALAGVAAAVAVCSRCNVALVPTQVQNFVSPGGCLGALSLGIGVMLLLTDHGFYAGILLMILGLLGGAVGGKKTIMVCPTCASRGTTISS